MGFAVTVARDMSVACDATWALKKNCKWSGEMVFRPDFSWPLQLQGLVTFTCATHPYCVKQLTAGCSLVMFPYFPKNHGPTMPVV